MIKLMLRGSPMSLWLMLLSSLLLLIVSGPTFSAFGTQPFVAAAKTTTSMAMASKQRTNNSRLLSFADFDLDRLAFAINSTTTTAATISSGSSSTVDQDKKEQPSRNLQDGNNDNNNDNDNNDNNTTNDELASLAPSPSPSADYCQICYIGELIPDFYPPYEPIEGIVPAGLSCQDFQDFVAPNIPSGTDDCMGLQGLTPVCCTLTTNTTTRKPWQCEQDTRRQILANMDTVVPPTPNFQESPNVEVILTYHTVTDINVQEGTAEMFVWLELVWTDPRLRWNFTEDTCATVVSARANQEAELTEIWVPEFDLMNRITSVQNFVDAHADVFPDGSVLWRRSGSLKAICQFQGLAKIPYDALGCQLWFGTQLRLGLPGQINMEFEQEFTGGFVMGDFTPVYTEYQLMTDRVNNTKVVTDGFQMLQYTFYFQRAKEYYVFNIVIPTTILTFVSFGTFLLDLRVGERLGYGMALALVVVAQQIVTGDLLPVTNEKLWIDKFVGWSFYWVIFGLVESVFMGYLFFIRQDKGEKPTTAAAMTDDSITTNNNNHHNNDQNDHIHKEFAPVEDSSDPDQDNHDDGDDEEKKSHLQQEGDGTTSDIVQRKSPTSTMTTAAGIAERRDTKKRQSSVVVVVSKKIRKSLWYTYPLRKIDHFCFFFCLFTYCVFLIAMFTSRDRWGQKIDPVYDT